jgi:hypothetical protein
VTESTSHVEQQVQQRISAAKARVQAAKERRDELSAARRRGLRARHANKLQRLAEQRQAEDKGYTLTGSPGGDQRQDDEPEAVS